MKRDLFKIISESRWAGRILNRIRKTPLRLILIIPFVVQIVAVVGLIGYLSFKNGQNSVSDLANQLMKEIGQRIDQNLSNYMDNTEEINRTNFALVQSGLLNPGDTAKLREHFWAQLHNYKLASTVAMITDNRDSMALERDNVSFILREYDKNTRQSISFRLNEKAEKIARIKVVENFDSRNDPPHDPWYPKVKAQKGSFWTLVVSLARGPDDPELMVVNFLPLKDKQQNTIGVTASSIYLSQFGSFLTSLRIGQNGQAFVIDKQGNLIATSTGEIPFRQKGDATYAETTVIEKRRIAALNSKNPFTSASMQAILDKYGRLDRVSKAEQFNYRLAGARYFVQTVPFKKGNLNWTSIIVVPESDFMKYISTNARSNLLLSIIALLIAIIIGIFTARWVTAPILHLNAAANRIAKGEWDMPVSIARADEIGELANAFNSMAVQLEAAFKLLQKEVAERTQAEEALRESRENLLTTLNSIGDGVMSTDLNGNIVGMNPIAEKLTGWKFKEAKGKPLTEVFHIVYAGTGESVDSPVSVVLAEKHIVGLANHTILISKDGTEYHVADSGAPIRDADGNITGVVLVFRDVTEKLKIEEELFKAKKLESIGVLAGGIAHDFNNILMGLFGNIELAKMKLPQDHKAYAYIETANHALERATQLTKQLLTFAKGGAPILETVSLQQVVRDSIKFNLSGSNVKPSLHLPDDLWQIKADKGQISQVIANLTINAKEAMPGGGNLYVEAENVKNLQDSPGQPLTGDFIKLTMRDEGVGISAKHLERIFDPYFSTKQTGSGLGLAIVYSIIAKHNGHIGVESIPDIGTTFSIFLPAQKTILKTMATVHPPPVDKPTLASARILIVDDEEMVRNISKAMLQSIGYETDFAGDGKEAIEKYTAAEKNNKPFDVVIMDLTIPGGLGGKEAIKELLAIDAEAKVIVSSGYSTDPVLAHYGDYGFKGRLVKPFQMDDLKKELLRVIKTR